jgi:putative aminopeptidase FrvX
MILKRLSEAIGVSGDEGEVREVVLEAVGDHVDDVRIDAMGNVLALKRGKGRLPSPRDGDRRMRVLGAAHMDEIGLMVVDHEKDGYLRVRPVGGIDVRLLPGSLLNVGDGRKPGVIGIKPIHLLKEDEREKVAKMEELAIDIGAKTEQEAEKLAPVGTYATFATEFRELGPTVMGKAFDDRVGCAVLVELLRGERFRFDFHAVFTVQEEVGLRGARVAAYAVDPDCAIALEGTVADDLPKDKDVSPTTELGKGPAVTVMDRSFIADRRLVGLITSTAQELGIPYQIKQPGIGGTDSGAIYQSGVGVPSVTVAVPCRYIHSPAAILNREDLDNTVRLVRESLSRLKPATLATEQGQ